MDEGTPHIDVRAVQVADAPALLELDYSFETDRIYTLRVQNRLAQARNGETAAFSFELLETPVDPPLYKNYRERERTIEEIEAVLQQAQGGYVALMEGKVAGAILLRVEEWCSVARIEDVLVGHQFRRYGVGTLLLHCACDWARKHNCWAITLETQNVNYPAIQFYLRSGLEIWSIGHHFYPPGPNSHEVAIIMGKRLATVPL